MSLFFEVCQLTMHGELNKSVLSTLLVSWILLINLPDCAVLMLPTILPACQMLCDVSLSAKAPSIIACPAAILYATVTLSLNPLP